MLLILLYLMLYITNASDTKSVQQVCSALLNSYYNKAMQPGDKVEEQKVDSVLSEFNNVFMLSAMSTSNDVGTIKELTLNHCFPIRFTLEEKLLRLNVLLSLRHYLYLFFKQNTVSLYEMVEKCFSTGEKQHYQTKGGIAMIKKCGENAQCLFFADQQPMSFKIFRIPLNVHATNNGFKFYWNHNQLIKNQLFAEIIHGDHNSVFASCDKIDNCLFTEKRSIIYYGAETLLKVGDMIKVTKDIAKLNIPQDKVLEIIQIDKHGNIYAYDEEAKFTTCIENSYFFHFFTLPRKKMVENVQFDKKEVKIMSGKELPWGMNIDWTTWEINEVISREQGDLHGIKIGWKLVKWKGKIINEYNKTQIKDDLLKGTSGVMTFSKPQTDITSPYETNANIDKTFNEQENLALNDKERFEGIIRYWGDSSGIITCGKNDDDIHFYYKNARKRIDTFARFDKVNFYKGIFRGMVNALDVVKVKDDDTIYRSDDSNIFVSYDNAKYPKDTFRSSEMVNYRKETKKI